MTGPSALYSLPMLFSTKPAFPNSAANLAWPSHTQGIRISQDLPPKTNSLLFQQTIPQQQHGDLAYFPKGDQVVVSGDGVFVPSAIFGQSPDLHFVIHGGPSGREVVVFSRVSASQQASVSEHDPNQQAEHRWLVANRLMHVGQWVALSGDHLLATGENAPEVYTKARELGVAVPFVAYVDPDDHLPFAGW